MKNLLVVTIVLAVFVGLSISDSCIVCNSASDETCLIAPWLIPAQTCTARCYSRIVDGRTLRGCSAQFDERVLANCTLENNCELCNSLDGGTCNNAVFPAHRLQCHQCVGSLASNCSATVTTNPQPCPLWANEDSCYIRRTESTIERGCLSSSANRCQNLSHCFVCNGHGCNSFNSTDSQVPLSPNSASFFYPTFSMLLTVCLILAFNKW